MLGSPAGPGAPSQRGLWTSAPISSATGFTADGFSKYGVYSLFPGGPTFGSALYSHANAFGRFTSGQFQPTPGSIFHGSHKVSDSLFSSTGYTFGAPTPPPGSPYSPIPVAQLELLAKGINSNIIIQQATDYSLSPKKIQITEKRCDEKCCNLKTKACICQDESSLILKGKYSDNGSGCSRTNPIEWGNVNVKKEPGHPCQVAEITTSISPVIKVEVASPTQKNGDKDISPIIATANGNIPVGIAVARQRIQQPELINSPSLPPAGLLTTVNAAGQIKEIARLSEIESTQAGMAASVTGGGAAGGTILHCPDDRSTALASWPMGGAQSSSLTAPTLWQYPAPVPMESMVPMPPVGFQLVRDPTSGGFLLLPTTTSLEPIQQTVVWPSYPQPSPLLLPPMPPPPLQLLSSATDYLSSSATYHQQTQTHSTRLVAVTTDTKRKLPLPPTTLIKIEADASNLDQSKTISTMSSTSGSVFTDQSIAPLLTTHVIYQHPPNLILSQPTALDTSCKSQVTSPLPCLTPPPEIPNQPEETVLAVDASNQTDTPICSEDDNTLQTLPEIISEPTVNSTLEEESGMNEKIPEESSQDTEQTTTQEIITNSPQQMADSETPVLAEIEPEKEVAKQNNTIKPDLSGLELLSNSIVEFESCRNNFKTEDLRSTEGKFEGITKNFEEPKELSPIKIQEEMKPTEDALGGLDLLCALAEQRILEESSDPKVSRMKNKSSKREKRKSRRHSDEPRHKKHKSDKTSDEERRYRLDLGIEKGSLLRRSASEGNSGDIEGDIKCTCRDGKYKSYHNQQSEEDVQKFLASKSQVNCCQNEWPCMNAMEIDMRMRLADLQRRYKEKQKELNKLNNKKRHHHHHHHHHHHSKCSKKRSRNKSHSDHNDTPPPLLDPVEIEQDPIERKQELLRPPTLCAIENIKTSKHSSSKRMKLEKSVSEEKDDKDREKIWCTKRKSSTESRRNSHDKERKSSSKKRKVGRPKKISDHDIPTETIVAKKPKTGSFVGYLMAAKEKLQMRQSFSDSPPRFIDDSAIYIDSKNNNNNNIVVKESNLESNIDFITKNQENDEAEWESESEYGYPKKVDGRESVEKENEGDVEQPIKVKIEIPDEEEIQEEDAPHICTLTPSHLEKENLRVLTAMGGLFYAGQLHAVQPPDVYSITLDGERGNRPHIMSREEILRDAIVEIAPKNTDELETGTRLCAYWSQQYRCLYPGSVAEPGTPNPDLDSKFVAVEFDDGDSGTIALEDIRLLPANTPVMEYDPNPLLSLSKRKRRTSSCAPSGTERRQSQVSVQEENKETLSPQIIKEEPTYDEDSHKERKRLKKKKKEKIKLKLIEKKKKRKHRCGEEKCKDRKHHKKRRKHKKHHHDKEQSSSTSTDEKIESDECAITDTLKEDEEEEADLNRDSGIHDSFNIDEDSTTSTENKPADDEGTFIPNPEDEVTMDDISEVLPKSKKIRDRQASCESSRSKMSAFLPARQLWSWSGKGYKRPRGRGRSRKEFYRSIQRGKESISVGDSAVFLSTGRPDRPYIGRIEAMWEQSGTMVVRVKWFYHPEETIGCPQNLQYPGALFESPHVDENDVQTISHKCEVLPLNQYIDTLGNDPRRFAAIYENNDIYYLAGYYDPTNTSLKMEDGIPFQKIG